MKDSRGVYGLDVSAVLSSEQAGYWKAKPAFNTQGAGCALEDATKDLYDIANQTAYDHKNNVEARITILAFLNDNEVEET